MACDTRIITPENIGGQRWSLPAIHGLRDTGASLHNGIEPPTRGFSEAITNFKYYINQLLAVFVHCQSAGKRQ